MAKTAAMPELRRYEEAIQRLLPSLTLYGWQCVLHRKPIPGDLVMLTSAPMSVWHLSFYREDCNDGYHMLESVKTGQHCRWGNVGFYIVNTEKVGGLDRIEWTDAQFEFERKFRKAWHKGDFYINIPFIAGWDGDNVLISFRTRYGLDEATTPTAPLAWRKITQRALLDHLTAGAEAHAAAREPLTAKPGAEGA